MGKKYVYSFGANGAEGNKDMKDALGGKGANLAEMASLGLPVPPGFTITTEVCRYVMEHGAIVERFAANELQAKMPVLNELLGV